MFCPKCGTENNDANTFCINCGNNLHGITGDRDAILRERGGGGTLIHQRVFEPGELIGDDGRYEIEKYLGKGGMGIVYKAHDKTLDIPVAIKFLPAVMSQDLRSVKNFQREAQAAAKLNHPNIVRIYHFDQFEGDYFITMEFIDGPTLLDLIVEKSPMSVEETFGIVEQICSGLAYAHSRNVYHRDIKPANIMLTSADEVKITDFGIARVVKDTTISLSNQPLDTSGTLAYMSPEQLRGKKTDGRSDLYSLGIVIYEMFTGYPPFRGGDLTYQHLHEEPEPIESVPTGVNAIVMKCLEKKSADRYASADELRKALTSPKRTKEIVNKKDGAPMVLIPAGEFEMGTDADEIPELVRWAKKWYSKVEASRFERETPRHTVYLDAFYIDKYEVTVGQYKKFIKETGHKAPDWSEVSEYALADKHPMIYVSWNDAQAYCKWAGKRLPTEAEWEKAARGGLVGKKFPWGDEAADSSKANYDDNVGKTTPVGSYSPNGYGLYDMAGNVWEWCADWYDSNYYSSSPYKNPTGPASGGTSRVVRGGSWTYYSYSIRAAQRSLNYPSSMGHYYGFRCVSQDLTP